MKKQQTTIYVALSGGVDSSVAALLLKRAGHRVVGVYMKPWSPKGLRCMWHDERADAVRVAAKLGIALETWDFSREYGTKVAQPMIDGYRRGITPNPDVECNRHIKFGLFAARAFRQGADVIATGHYAQIKKVRSKNGECQIVKAKDANKDQTYFLWAVPPAVLAQTLFPIGHLTKPQVRAIARRAGLHNGDKADSQGVCFVGDLNVKEFLVGRIKPRSGMIYHTNGKMLGRHDGAAYYTIGQRHGLDIRDGGGPYFVVRKDIRRNTVTVGPEQALYRTRSRLTAVVWHAHQPKAGARLMVKVRYRTPAVAATLRGGVITFAQPVRAIAPGQSAVFYRGSRLLGGGILA